MKKIGIISDTHSWWDKRYAQYFKDCDEVWHAGDIGNEAILTRLEAVVPVVRAVYGNADGGVLRQRLNETEIFGTEGVKVVLTHIGGYPGRYAPGMKSRLQLSMPQLMVCGHSHILKVMPDPSLGVLVVNPGAAGRQGWQRVRTLVTLNLEDGRVTHCQVIELADDPKHPQGEKIE
ncbi:MAG: metallophosphoesterase family protein [Bacteroidales bacterium]|nr:metallophosphoesterase family protein [Candidatus Sodaliphilus aphodohippi]